MTTLPRLWCGSLPGAALKIVCLFCVFVLQSAAHPVQLSTVRVDIDQQKTRVVVVIHTSQLAGASPDTAIPARLHLRLDGVPFRPSKTSLTFDRSDETATWQGEIPRRSASVAIDSPLFSEYPGDATVVLVYRDGQFVDRGVVDRESPSAIVGETASAVFQRFITMGIHHILSGADHILFILGLLLVGGTLRGLLLMVTAFTISHSITLSVTALQIGSLPSRFVEPVIALSILAVGIENLWRRSVDTERRMWFAFGFGFFHGFGFAGALAEAGLPRQSIAWSLAAFNIGVEIGQACIVLTAVPLLRFLDRHNPALSSALTRCVSACIAVAGVIWFVQRLQL
jgi:hydrogenase/urease accessory protein HupE